MDRKEFEEAVNRTVDEMIIAGILEQDPVSKKVRLVTPRVGAMIRVEHDYHAANYRTYPRVMRAKFLGVNSFGEWDLSGRPVFGTTSIRVKNIKSWRYEEGRPFASRAPR